MEETTITLHTAFNLGDVDPRVFGGFLEHMGRCVYEGVFEPSSVHADEQGFRRDVLGALERLRMPVIRYPGGNFASGYHWLDGVGPVESRPTVRELAWQSIETNRFGTEEFMRLCQRLDWTPMLSVNLGTGTPEEARTLGRVLQLTDGYVLFRSCALTTEAKSPTRCRSGAWVTRWMVPGNSVTFPPNSMRFAPSRRRR